MVAVTACVRNYFDSDMADIFDLLTYVVNVHSVDLFKTRLDKFWRCQDVEFDWRADLTGDRSESGV